MDLLATISATSSAIHNTKLSASDKIQIFIAGTTLFAALVALFKDWVWRKINRPILEVVFDDKDSECFHLTKQDAFESFIPTYYIRLKVKNTGKNTMENVEAVLEKVTPKPSIFISLNLSWSLFNDPSGVMKSVRIPYKQTRPLDVIEVMQPEALGRETAVLEMDPSSPKTVKERYEKYLSSGFRTCTVKPHTLSDVFDKGDYIFYVGIYADNTDPLYLKLSIKYDGGWTDNTEEMRKNHLKIKVIKTQNKPF